MQVYSVNINEFSNDDYTLIGIHTTLPDYQLAYLLNKHLKTSFKRSKNNLDFDNQEDKLSYSLYEYEDGKFDYFWFLINNIAKTTTTKPKGLFNESDIIRYLIPEKKKIDYFVKFEIEVDTNFINETLEKINQIPQVITSYSIEPSTLKSKEFLIF